MKIIAFVPLMVLLIGCAHSEIVTFPQAQAGTKKSRMTLPTAVGVYRSTKPFDAFSELGMISYRSNTGDVRTLFERIRTDAAEYGADAVVDVKISDETHTEWQTEKKCHDESLTDSNGNSTTQSVCEDVQVLKEVTTYVIRGSLIRSKQ